MLRRTPGRVDTFHRTPWFDSGDSLFVKQLMQTPEYDFTQTLIGKITHSWGIARNSKAGMSSGLSGQQKLAATLRCNELSICLEALGGSRLDVVLVAVDR